MLRILRSDYWWYFILFLCGSLQTEYNDQEMMGILDCAHDYHLECIKKWLLVKNSCPICKCAALTTENKESWERGWWRWWSKAFNFPLWSLSNSKHIYLKRGIYGILLLEKAKESQLLNNVQVGLFLLSLQSCTDSPSHPLSWWINRTYYLY